MIGRTNVGGGTGGTLTVYAPAGVTVVLSTDGVTAKYTKTANGDGVAVFKGVSSGTWYVAIIDGDQFAYKAVTVTTDYATTITFFSATIKVTYPAGSTAHIEGPNGYYAQSPDTSGYWEVTVPAAGDYLVCADDSTTGQGVYKTVSITEDGQSVDVTLSYELVIYDNGSVNTDDTGGGFEVTYMPYNSGAGAASSHKLTYNEDYINFSSNGNGTAYLHTKSPIDFTAYTTLHFKVKRGAGTYSQAFVAANPTEPSSSVYIANDASVFSKIGSNSDSDYTDVDFDISSISGEQYVGMGFYVNGNSAYVYCKEIKLT